MGTTVGRVACYSENQFSIYNCLSQHFSSIRKTSRRTPLGSTAGLIMMFMIKGLNKIVTPRWTFHLIVRLKGTPVEV